MPASRQMTYKRILAERMALYGHRNWIVVADAAYPAQANAGIETIATGAPHLRVLKDVLAAVDSASHVRPIIHTDAELDFVAEQDAKGVTTYRRELQKLIGNRPVKVTPHEQIISDLDAAGRLFRVMILKTTLTIPYTSVFLQLDCGYWSAEAESRLRSSIAGK